MMTMKMTTMTTLMDDRKITPVDDIDAAADLV
jgi:hypothetical protein